MRLLQRNSPCGSLRGSLQAKACPLRFILSLAVQQGLGVECASHGECLSALEAGCDPSLVVFDSPAKTREEIRWALEMGITLNADNLSELERVDEALKLKVSGSKFRWGFHKRLVLL